MSGLTSFEATDSESNAYLRDPACGVPFDIHFEIEDMEGTTLGRVGGHKTIMALKSPVFRAMLFGPLAEGDPIMIKNTSMYAFKRMLTYMHDAQRDRRPWAIEIRELFLIADLAERYNLPGLTEETIEYAKGYIFPSKERLVEIFQLAEDFHIFAELSEAVLERCASFLRAILETPQDVNNFLKEWSAKNAEEASAALRLLARVDHEKMSYANKDPDSQKVISHLRNIEQSIQPRYRLQQLLDMITTTATAEAAADEVIDQITAFGGTATFIQSLRICQMKDKDKAALEGTPLTKKTLVEDGFTHKKSVRLHLDLIAEGGWEVGGWGWELNKEQINSIWKTMFEDEETIGIPWAQSITLAWFISLIGNRRFIDNAARHHLAEKLRSCDEAIKALPEYNDICDKYM